MPSEEKREDGEKERLLLTDLVTCSNISSLVHQHSDNGGATILTVTGQVERSTLVL